MIDKLYYDREEDRWVVKPKKGEPLRYMCVENDDTNWPIVYESWYVLPCHVQYYEAPLMVLDIAYLDTEYDSLKRRDMIQQARFKKEKCVPVNVRNVRMNKKRFNLFLETTEYSEE